MTRSTLKQHFKITPRGPFSLAASTAFLNSFAPAAHKAVAPTNHLHLAFVADGSDQAIAVCLSEEDNTVVGEISGEADTAIVRKQVERILSLDVDGSSFPSVGKHDPIVGKMQARFPGLRPLCFYSPYEAGAWILISHRIRITQAARVKAHMAEELGEALEIHGETAHAFPSPARLLQVESFPGLFGRKIEYLHHLAEATIEGRLDAAHLRSIPQEQALEELQQLPGIGIFSAEHILLRGAGDPDYLTLNEPRLARAIAMAYGLKSEPSSEELRAISEGWRPYRTWVTFLLRHMLEEETHEIASK
jgi:DNA-3-methyladenine glycosylase II